MDGWIKIHRKIINDEMYYAEPFTRMQAFLDLVLIANYQPTVIYKRGIRIDVGRGQTVRSEHELAERWRWSRGKVRRFLSVLETDHKIVQQKSRVCSCISIVNYDKYQLDGTTDSTTDGTTDGTTNKKKEKNILYTTSTRAREEKDNIDEEVVQLKSGSEWVESICMKHRIIPAELDSLFTAFADECRCNGLLQHKDINDAKRHFNNWLRIYKQQQRNGNNGTTDNKRTSPAENIAAAQADQIRNVAATVVRAAKR